MKFITFIFTLLFSSIAMSHTDHALGEGNLHALYHAIFWAVFTAVVIKAVLWFKNKKQQKLK